MAHGLSPVSSKDIPTIASAKPVVVSLATRIILIVLIVVGVLAFLQALIAGHKVTAWTALQVNFNFWFGIAAASSGFAAVFHICNAEWSRPIRRIFESALPFFMFCPLILVVLYLGHENLFLWSHTAIHGKELWLSSRFVFVRDILAASILVYVIHRVVMCSLKRDLLALRSGALQVDESAKARWANSSFDALSPVVSAQDLKHEIQKVSDEMGRLSPLVVITYALVMSLIAFDMIMSVDPYWYSTLFGAFYFMSAVYGAVAFAAISLCFLRVLHPLFRAKIERRTLHDLGKLLFGFGIFWAYMFWSHYLPIWYSNMPEETAWLIVRARQYPWRDIAWVILGMCFIVPFFLGLSRDLKQVSILLFATAVIVVIGLWLLQFLLFVPTISPKAISLNLTDVAVGLGFMGAFFLGALNYLERYPLIPFGDFLEK